MHSNILFTRSAPQSPQPNQVYRIPAGSTVAAAVTNDSFAHGSPVISDSGEMVWIEQDMSAPVPTSRIVSSTRGVLLPSANDVWAVDANNCGDLAYMANNNGQTTIYRLGNAAPCFSSSNPTAPVIVTDVPAFMTKSIATLKGRVSDGGATTTVSFEYGLDTTYGNSVSAGIVTANSGITPVSAVISGLTCGTSYHYRIVATNSTGTTSGSDNTIFTNPCLTAPFVSTGSTNAISATGVTLNGAVYSYGEVATVSFDYGQTLAYGSSVVVQSSGNGDISAVVTGLDCSTTYHYRINGQNSVGITSGQNAIFTTTACPPPGSVIISTIAGNGTTVFSGDGGAATSAGFYYPHDIATDSAGNIYIADTFNGRIRKLTLETGVVSTVAGTGTAGFNSDDILATSAKINASYGVSVDGAGNIYIADTYNHRIRRVDAVTSIITTVAGNGTAGFSGDGGPGSSASLNNPRKAVLDSVGNIYIADTNNNRIRMVDASTGIISTVAGNGTGAFAGDGESATSASLYWPYSVAVDNPGNLYIADYMNMRIRKVEKTTGIISTVAGKSGTGYISYSGEDGPATSAQISTPYGVTVDAAGNIYIAASYRILKVDAVTGILKTVAGNGEVGFSGDGGVATNATFNAPTGIVVDATGNLIVADTYNHRIRKVTFPELTITMTAGPNGTISGQSAINYGGSASYVIIPATGYHVTDVLVDGASVGVVSSYNFSNVTASHTISASFAINSYSITATAGSNGSISGAGTVNYGGSASYSITPAVGYHVADVLVDGASVGAVSNYNLTNVTSSHTISASFAINRYSITATAGSNGSISGPGVVNYGENATFTIKPSAYYRISNVLIDGVAVGALTSYTFSNVSSNHTIRADFIAFPDLTVTKVTAPTSAFRGKNISVSSSIRNLGGDTTGSFNVTYYLSKNSVISSSDIILGTRTVTSLRSGSTTILNDSFAVPSRFSAGKYYVGVMVDSGSAVIELNETNNIKATQYTTMIK